MLNNKPTTYKGSSTIGESDGGRIIVAWRTSLRPLLLVRGLLGKAFKKGFSAKEYLVLFDIVSLNFKSWDRKTLGQVLVVLFLISCFRKKVINWDGAIPPLEKSLSRLLRKWGTVKTAPEFLAEYHLHAFLNVRLTDKEFSMKTLHTRSFPARLIHRVRNPSAVGSKSNRKLSKLPTGVIVPQDVRSRTLDEEIKLSLRNLYSFLGIEEAVPLPYMEKKNLPDESIGKDEIPETKNSLFNSYLRRVKS
jgi:hypothetical protein